MHLWNSTPLFEAERVDLSEEPPGSELGNISPAFAGCDPYGTLYILRLYNQLHIYTDIWNHVVITYVYIYICLYSLK